MKEVYDEELETSIIMKRAVRASKDISKGEKITREHLIILRPRENDAICARELSQVIGKTTVVDISAGQSLTKRDLA